MLVSLIKQLITDKDDPLLKDLSSKNQSDLREVWIKTLEQLRKTKQKTVLIVDELSELNTKDATHHLNWLPPATYTGLYIIISTNNAHHITMDRVKLRYPLYMEMGTIDIRTRQSIAWHYLGAYNKKLDLEQTRLLVEHEGASFPIWLRIACEELRVFGDFRTVTEKIRNFPGTLEGQ